MRILKYDHGNMSRYGGYGLYLGFYFCKFKKFGVQNACKLLLYWSTVKPMRWLIWFLRRQGLNQIFSSAKGHITLAEKMHHVQSVVTWWKPNRLLKDMGDFESSWNNLLFATFRVYLSLVFKKLQNKTWIIHFAKLIKKLLLVYLYFKRICMYTCPGECTLW